MAVSFPRLPRWLCGGNTKKESKGSSSLKKISNKTGSSSSTTVKRIKRGWIGRGGGEEEKMGNVVFPEPDDPEWSVGWVEPHGPGFKSEDDTGTGGGGFVVLVPCYKKLIDGSGNQIPTAVFSPAPDVKNIEQWLSSMGKL